MRSLAAFQTRTASLFGMLPFLWLAGLLALAVRARIFLSYWPRPSRPDPKTLPFELHYTALWIGLYLLLSVLAVSVVVFLIGRFRFRGSFSPTSTWMFVGGASVILAMTFAPQWDFNLIAWFFD